jgi:hypothetical protein
MARLICNLHNECEVIFVTRYFAVFVFEDRWDGKVIRVEGELFPGQDYAYFVNEGRQLTQGNESEEDFSLSIMDELIPYCRKCFLNYMQKHENIDNFDIVPTVSYQ